MDNTLERLRKISGNKTIVDKKEIYQKLTGKKFTKKDHVSLPKNMTLYCR